MKPEQQAAKWFAEGVKNSLLFDRDMKHAREHGMDAAFFFLRARELSPHGAWGEFCDLHADEISPRMVRFWCQLADEAVAWVKAAQPALKSITEIQAAARELVMQSPKPLIALCRELGHMRKFGEYDAVKYATRKIGSTTQIEFDFLDLLAPMDHLSHFGDPNYTFKYPEGRDESEFIDLAIAKTRTALTRLETIKKHGRIIET